MARSTLRNDAGCVQVLDLGNLLKYDEMSASLPFQLATLDAILKAGRLEYILHPLSLKSLDNLATSDDSGLPDPPFKVKTGRGMP